MKKEDYPAQEPLSAFARGYGEEAWSRGSAVTVQEFRYGDDPYQSLSVAVPQRPRRAVQGAVPGADGGAVQAAFPVLVFLHGGGWTSGYKEWNHFMAPPFTAAGVMFVSLGYRLAPRVLFPEILSDCIQGLSWVHRHIAPLGGDPERIFVGGHSAGGHLSALLGVTHDWQGAAGVPRDVVRGCLPVSGVYLFGEGSGLSARPRFLGPEDTDTDRAASPLMHLETRLESPLPPFMVAYGEKDFPHLITQSRAMIAALRARGGLVEELMLEGKSHLEAHLATVEETWRTGALHFIARHAG